MIPDRGLIPHIDWRLIGAIVGLALIGIATIYSVTWDARLEQPGREFWAQLYALPVALIAMVVCMSIDYRSLAQRSLFIYAALIVMLLAVAFFGVTRNGSRRWITIASGFNLQPSEFARLAVALVLAGFYSENRTARSVRDIIAPRIRSSAARRPAQGRGEVWVRTGRIAPRGASTAARSRTSP